ncbi:MAG: Uma2 family endonuclease [Actinomycetota bacterium]|nr:Uma2 family endonuclease [Actinomycetota bacterium]
MPVQVDPLLPVHPLTVADLARMVDAKIFAEDDRVELLDGVLVEMTPPGPAHSYALRELTAIITPVAVARGLRVAIQDSLDLGSPISLPQPDLAVVPVTSSDRHASDALLVVEIAHSSRRIDLGRKASIYAEGGVPEYWVLDVERRELVVHRKPVGGRYTSIHTLGEHETVAPAAVDVTVPLVALL